MDTLLEAAEDYFIALAASVDAGNVDHTLSPWQNGLPVNGSEDS
jgi:hypothetical protein